MTCIPCPLRGAGVERAATADRRRDQHERPNQLKTGTLVGTAGMSCTGRGEVREGAKDGVSVSDREGGGWADAMRSRKEEGRGGSAGET